MFTGIIQSIAEIVSIKKKKLFYIYKFFLSNKIIKNLKLGFSISINGCCLTVSKISKNFISFDIINNTLNITNFKKLHIGDKVNIERSMKLTDEIGGHLMSGHIMTTAKILKISNIKDLHEISFILKNQKLMKFIFKKGFIGIDGISLTINHVYKNKFTINFIPKTLLLTTIGLKKVGDIVNIEIDFKTQIIVESVKSFLKINKNIY